jgi:hypothetical protein
MPLDKRDTDLVFAVYQDKADSLYNDLCKSFANTLDRSGPRRRKIHDEGGPYYFHEYKDCRFRFFSSLLEMENCHLNYLPMLLQIQYLI